MFNWLIFSMIIVSNQLQSRWAQVAVLSLIEHFVDWLSVDSMMNCENVTGIS